MTTIKLLLKIARTETGHSFEYFNFVNGGLSIKRQQYFYLEYLRWYNILLTFDFLNRIILHAFSEKQLFLVKL